MKARNALRPRAVVLGLLACAVLGWASAGRADEADKLARQIISEAKTRAEAAKKLLDAAGMLKDAPPVQVKLCVKAYECGITTPAGHASALAALDMLDKAAPDRADVWSARRAEIYRLQYLKGDRMRRLVAGRKYVEALLAQAAPCRKSGNWADAVKHHRQAHQVARAINLPEAPAIYMDLRTAENHVMVQNRLAALKAALAKNPDDLTSRTRLVETYLVDLDMPGQAAKLLSDTLDATLRANVSLAAKEAAELTDADFLTLGQWYRSLAAGTAIKETKARLLTRALDNFKMFLEVYTKKDVQRLRATTGLKAAQAELDRIGVTSTTTTGQPEWIDLLAHADPKKYTVTGEWSRQGTGLYGSCSREGLIGVPITAVGSYDLQATFTLKSGAEGTISMPVGAGQVALIVGGRYGSLLGLSMIDGKPLDRGNPTAVKSADRKGWLRVGAKTTIDVSVRIKGDQAEITATLNGKKIVEWTGSQSSLTWHEIRALPAKTFGLGSYRSTLLWHTAKVKMLDSADRTLRWVSKDATYKPSSVYSSCPPQATLLTGVGKLNRYDASVLTNKEANPHVIITLKRIELVKRIILDQRRGRYSKYNSLLSVAISTDRRRWTTAWRAKAVQQSWVIDFKLPMRARYLKISPTVTDRVYLALASVRVYAPAR